MGGLDTGTCFPASDTVSQARTRERKGEYSELHDHYAQSQLESVNFTSQHYHHLYITFHLQEPKTTTSLNGAAVTESGLVA